MRLNTCLALGLALAASGCQDVKLTDSQTKNFFEEPQQVAVSAELSEDEVIGNFALYAQSIFDRTVFELNLKADRTGYVRNNFGQGDVTWKLQRGRLILSIENLESLSSFVKDEQWVDETMKELQWVISKEIQQGIETFRSKVAGVISYSENRFPQEFFENEYAGVSKVNVGVQTLEEFIADGDKIAVSTNTTDYLYGIVMGDQLVSAEDGTGTKIERAPHFAFTANGNRYEYRPLQVNGNVADTLLIVSAEDGRTSVERRRIVRQSFEKALSTEFVAGVYEWDDNAVYRFSADGIFQIVSPFNSSVYSWKIEDNRIVATRWLKVNVNHRKVTKEDGTVEIVDEEFNDYLLDDEDTKACAADPVANRCIVQQRREFIPLDLGKSEFHFLRKAFFNESFQEGVEAQLVPAFTDIFTFESTLD